MASRRGGTTSDQQDRADAVDQHPRTSCRDDTLDAGSARAAAMEVAAAQDRDESIAVVVGLERALDADADVLGLLLRQRGQLDAELLEMEAGDFLIEVLGQHVDLALVLLAALPQLELGEHLVGERGAHHERRMAGGAA